MRVSRKFWGGMIAGGIVGTVLGVVVMPMMRRPWSMMGTWRPDLTDMMGKQMQRAGKIAGKWRR